MMLISEEGSNITKVKYIEKFISSKEKKMKNFEIAGGSVTGTSHVIAGKNNQDAFYWEETEDAIIAVVSDGCGSGKHSEVGSKFLVRLAVKAAKNWLFAKEERDWSKWDLFQQELENGIHGLLTQLQGNSLESLIDYTLATMIGVVITPEKTAIFYLGDGVYSINGEITGLGPFPGNEPPYIAYNLFGPARQKFEPSLLYVSVKEIPTIEVENILLGTDGISDLISSEEHNLPGKSEPVGLLSQFWQEDSYFKNPDKIRRRLAMVNCESKKPDWENKVIKVEKGLLPDDTTLVVIRKIKEGSDEDGNSLEGESASP